MFGSSKLTMPAGKVGGKLSGGERLARGATDSVASPNSGRSTVSTPGYISPADSAAASVVSSPGASVASSASSTPRGPSSATAGAASVAAASSSAVAASSSSSSSYSPYLANKQLTSPPSMNGSSSGGSSIGLSSPPGLIKPFVRVGIGVGVGSATSAHSRSTSRSSDKPSGGPGKAVAGHVSLTLTSPLQAAARLVGLSLATPSRTPLSSARASQVHSASHASAEANDELLRVEWSDPSSRRPSHSHSHSASGVAPPLPLSTDELELSTNSSNGTPGGGHSEPNSSRLSVYRPGHHSALGTHASFEASCTPSSRRDGYSVEENPLDSFDETVEIEEEDVTPQHQQQTDFTSSLAPVPAATFLPFSPSALAAAAVAAAAAATLTAVPPPLYASTQPPPYSFSSPGGGSHYRKAASYAATFAALPPIALPTTSVAAPYTPPSPAQQAPASTADRAAPNNFNTPVRKFHVPTQHHPQHATSASASAAATTNSLPAPTTASVFSTPTRSSSSSSSHRPASSSVDASSSAPRQATGAWMINAPSSSSAATSTTSKRGPVIHPHLTPRNGTPPLSSPLSKSSTPPSSSPPSISSVYSSNTATPSGSPVLLPGSVPESLTGTPPKRASLVGSSSSNGVINSNATSTSGSSRPPALSLLRSVAEEMELDRAAGSMGAVAPVPRYGPGHGHGQDQAHSSMLELLALQRAASERSGSVHIPIMPTPSPMPQSPEPVLPPLLALRDSQQQQHSNGTGAHHQQSSSHSTSAAARSRTKSQPEALALKKSSSQRGGIGAGHAKTPSSSSTSSCAIVLAPSIVAAPSLSGSGGRQTSAFAPTTSFQSFPLRMVFDSSWYGLRPTRHFPLPAIGGLIAGRYKLVRVLGHAAFSTCLHVIDLAPGPGSLPPPQPAMVRTVSATDKKGLPSSPPPSGPAAATASQGVHLCMKILKNQKEFIDAALDEVRILSLMGAAQDALGASVVIQAPLATASPSPRSISKRGSGGWGPASSSPPLASLLPPPSVDKHVLRLVDAFYFHETIFLLTDLCGPNLYAAMRASKACATWHAQQRPTASPGGKGKKPKRASIGAEEESWVVAPPDEIDTSLCLCLAPSITSPSSSASAALDGGKKGSGKQPSPLGPLGRPSKSPRASSGTGVNNSSALPLSPLTLGLSGSGSSSHGYIFTVPVLKVVAFQLLTALEFVHAQGFVHADLKPENVCFIDATPSMGGTKHRGLFPRVRLIDFGSCVHLPPSGRALGPLPAYVQSRPYRAPEVILGLGAYTHAIDLWALGALLVELFTAQTLFPLTAPQNGAHATLNRDDAGAPSVGSFHNLLTSLHKMTALFGQGAGFSQDFLRRIVNQPPPPRFATQDGEHELDDIHDSMMVDNGSRVLHFFELRAASSSASTVVSAAPSPVHRHVSSRRAPSPDSPLDVASSHVFPSTPLRLTVQRSTDSANEHDHDHGQQQHDQGDVFINILATPLAVVGPKGTQGGGRFFTPSSSPTHGPLVFATPSSSPGGPGPSFLSSLSSSPGGPSPTANGGCVYSLKSLGVAQAYGAMPSPVILPPGGSRYDSADWTTPQAALAQVPAFDERASLHVPREHAPLHALLTTHQVAQLHAPHSHTVGGGVQSPSNSNGPQPQRSGTPDHNSSPDRRQQAPSSSSASKKPPSGAPPSTGGSPSHSSMSSLSSLSFAYGTASSPSEWCEWLDLLSRLLTIDPQHRITAAQALAHPFFADVRP